MGMELKGVKRKIKFKVGEVREFIEMEASGFNIPASIPTASPNKLIG